MGETYVENSIQRLQMLHREIEEYETRIQQLKEQIELDAQDLIENAPTNDERIELATQIYWFLEFVGAAIVYIALGAVQNQILKYIYPAHITVSCRDCNKTFDVALTSRTKLRTLRKAYSNGSKTDQARCPECEERHAFQDANRAINWQREQEARRAEILRLKTMPYREYLQTEHWRNLRGQMLKRAKFHCQLCNRGDLSLHVHHRSYAHRGEEPYSDLIVLCADCHKTFHENGTLT